MVSNKRLLSNPKLQHIQNNGFSSTLGEAVNGGGGGGGAVLGGRL